MTQTPDLEERLRDFVLAFVKKGRQERLLTELFHPKKRYRGLSCFCHNAKDLLRSDCILYEGTDLSKYPDLPLILKKEKKLTLFSCDPAFDEEVLDSEEALKVAFYCQDMLIMMGREYAIVYEEVYTKGQTKYVLKKKE